MKTPRFLRLLPAVMVASLALLGLKTSGLVHDAYAAAAATDAPADPVPANKDFADGDDGIASAAQADVLTSMAQRRGALDARQTRIDTETAVLSAAEQRVDAKIAQLKALQDQITQLLVQRDDAQKAQIAALVKTYKTMAPKKAAPIFQALPDAVAIPVAQGMSAADLAAILQFMDPDQAQKLTVKLADRLTLPITADAAPVAPAQTASAAPAAAPQPTSAKPKS